MITSPKNYPDRPFLLADLRFYDPEYGERGKTPVLGGVVFRALVLGWCRKCNGEEKLSALYGIQLAKKALLDPRVPNLVAKSANLVARFLKS